MDTLHVLLNKMDDFNVDLIQSKSKKIIFSQEKYNYFSTLMHLYRITLKEWG